MTVNVSYKEMVRLRDYSSAFSRTVFTDIIKYQDYSHLNWLYNQYKTNNQFDSYARYLNKIYSTISKEYRCEYVYKNELLGHLIRQYGTKETSAYNEFCVGNSIVDIALFNGESKAFEIKTEYDTPKRLGKQIEDYKKIFDRCYIVIPIEKENVYSRLPVDESTGIIALKRENGRIYLMPVREAKYNANIDVEIMMSCLRTKEYESIVSSYLGSLPKIPACYMYKECLSIMKQIPQQDLKKHFISTLKKRQLNTQTINKVPSFLRQICLSLNLSMKGAETLLDRLEKPII